MAVQDFTIWSPGETDPGGNIDVTSTKVTFTDFPRSVDAWHVDDKGLDFFDGNFEYKATINLTTRDDFSTIAWWGISSVNKDFFYIATNPSEYEILIAAAAPPGSQRLDLYEIYNGSIFADSYNIALNTDYVALIERDEDVGVNGTVFCFVFDATEANLLATLSLALNVKRDLQFLNVSQSFNVGGAQNCTGYIENLESITAVLAVPHQHDASKVVKGVDRVSIVSKPSGGIPRVSTPSNTPSKIVKR